MSIKAKAYLHSSTERMYEIGKEIGLKGKALDFFTFALYEVEFELEVKKETGEATIIKVDSKELLK